MSEAARTLRIEDEGTLLAEVERLRRGGYVRRGNWNLAQICWHVARPMGLMDAPPPAEDVQRTAEQEEKKRRFVDHILATETPPPGTKDAPPMMVPPADAGDGAIDEFERRVRQMKAYPHRRITMGPIGPVAIDEYRKCNLFHAAHHLAFLEPKGSVARREGLGFADEDAVIADIRNLRKNGYARAGQWSLGMVCWHLEATTRARMAPGPFPEDTAEQKARRGTFEQVLASGRLPNGIVAPDVLVPPAAAGDEAVEACVATLERFKGFGGPPAPHRIFGTLTLEEARRVNRIHCAHHLSYLVANG